jgi:hypothetical protein
MWTCKNCDEELDDNFEICWKCGTESENQNINKESEKTFNYVPDDLSFAISPNDDYAIKGTQKIIDNDEIIHNNKKSNKSWLIIIIIFGIIIYFSGLVKPSTEKSTSNSEIQTQTNPCDDMDSYNKGFHYGTLQRGGLPDCDTYYYEGAANNKYCWCQGFMEGRK